MIGKNKISCIWYNSFHTLLSIFQLNSLPKTSQSVEHQEWDIKDYHPLQYTSQQDQSAKKKPKKSNNENEGDVSTIPQESDEIAT